jgi:multiple sugar transport system permease protein
VAFELVLGMALALIMHPRDLRPRTGPDRPRSSRTASSRSSPRSPGGSRGPPRSAGFVPKALGMDFDPLDPTHPFWNYFVVIATEVWKTTPFMALLLLAGLTLVPEELQEAARVDGASAWQRFWRSRSR